MGAILIVDDNEDLRELLAALLMREGYEVWTAENGARALEVLAEHTEPPCLILLDLMMPVMDGTEFLQVLRDRQQLDDLPVVVLSAGGRPSMAPGASHFMRKPPSHDLLLQTVREYCDAH